MRTLVARVKECSLLSHASVDDIVNSFINAELKMSDAAQKTGGRWVLLVGNKEVGERTEWSRGD
jgi:hypothetical protein